MCGFLLKTYKKICANDRRLWTNCRNHNTDESRWEGEGVGGTLKRAEGGKLKRAVQRLRSPHGSQCTLNDHELPAIVKWLSPSTASSLLSHFPWDSLCRTACGVVGGSDKNPSESIYWIMQFVKRLQLKIVVSFSHLPGFYWMIALS